MRLIFLILSTTLVCDLAKSTLIEDEKADSITADTSRKDRQFWVPAVPFPGFFPRQYWPPQHNPQFRRDPYSELDVDETDENTAQFRQNAFGLSNINSAVNPWAQLFAALPNNKIPDPNRETSYFGTCRDPDGFDGMCTGSIFCSKVGGRPSGSCSTTRVCCVNSISKCGGKMTLNNTYWRNPPAVSSDSSCALTVALDHNLIEQRKAVCQVRLDFINFVTAQPDDAAPGSRTRCILDTFVVGGVVNKVPVICGENTGQHMYLEAPASTTDLMLIFNFGISTTIRTWNIKVSMIPCGANYAAPRDCLQYFTAPSGTVKSFNWRDVSLATRQLADQDYKICFRNELINDKRATRICYTVCSVTAPNANAFSLSGAAAAGTALASARDAANCPNDYLLIPNGFGTAGGPPFADRYCGTALSPTVAVATASVPVCSEVRDFSIYYKTNADEAVNPAADTNNMGFCLTFDQRLP